MINTGTLIGCLILLVCSSLVSGLCSTCLEERCYDNGECIIGCVPGYVGEYCDEDCPPRCLNKVCHLAKSDGSVICTDGCEPGYCHMGCDVLCPADCDTCDRQCSSCNVTVDKICSPRYDTCDRETGSCIICRRRYYGNECNQECTACFTRADTISYSCLSGCDICQSKGTCQPGFHGDSCKLPCSPGCDKSSPGCNRATGECSDGCVSGYHGLTCNYTCSEHCLFGGCKRATGECSAGCVSGYHGPTCRSAVEKNSSDSGVLAIVLSVVTLLVMLVAAVIVFRRKLFQRYRRPDPGPESWELQEPLIPAHLDEVVKKLILDILRRTQQEIDSLTSGMIHVSAVDKVVDMLQSGRNWVTITGNAGDGKTTLGYLVLKYLRKNMSVYNVEEPEEYRQLLRFNEDRVIMFDDRFGAFTADQVLIDKWKTVMNDIHKQFTINGNQTKVIFISRKNVVNEARVFLGHFQDKFLDADNVVDLSSMKINDERLQILDYYLEQSNLEVSPEIKERVADLDIAHGFPHCSMMYPKLKAKKSDLDIKEFFKTPLKFLDITTAVLYKENCKDLFELLIKNNGRFDAYSVEDDKQRTSLLKVEREQEGSYITVWENGVCVFAHPSIYESVLSVICETDPIFCVKYATLSVIRQKLILTSDEQWKSPTQINVKPVEPVVKVLAKRFLPEIMKGDYSVFRHTLCENENFCKWLVRSCVYSDLAAPEQDGSKQFINQPGENGETMLWTALKSRHLTAVLTLVKAGAEVNLKDESGRTAVHYLCQLQTSTAATTAADGDGGKRHVNMDTIREIIIEGRGDVNIPDQNGKTPLHFLCHVQNSFAVAPVTAAAADDDYYEHRVDMETIGKVITERGGNVNICDQNGHTPLHYLFKCRTFSTEEIKWIIIEGKGDLNQSELNKSTPLHHLCAYSGLQLDAVDLVIREGNGDFNIADEHGTTPFHHLCGNMQVEFDVILHIVYTAKGDINMQDHNGVSPLHVLSKRSHQIKDILTLIHQGDRADMYGNTPLHFLCRKGGINADELQQQLKQIPETDMKKQNSLGHTPLDYLTDQDDSLPWRDGMVRRSSDDLVMCRLNQGGKWIFVLSPAMTLDTKRVYRELQVVDGLELNNMEMSGDIDRPGRFLEFWGTCSSPVPVPPSPSPFSLPSYWETDNTLTWKKSVGLPLLEMGVVVGRGNLDEGRCVSRLPNSLCVAVVNNCRLHPDRFCIQVRRRRDQKDWVRQVGECVTLSRPTSGDKLSLKFGVLLDVRRGRVALIDVERGKLLCKENVKFTEWVFPMFYVHPLSGFCATRMRLVSGREISITDQKLDLIQQALFD